MFSCTLKTKYSGLSIGLPFMSNNMPICIVLRGNGHMTSRWHVALTEGGAAV